VTNANLKPPTSGKNYIQPTHFHSPFHEHRKSWMETYAPAYGSCLMALPRLSGLPPVTRMSC